MKPTLAIGAALSLALGAFLWSSLFHHHHEVTIAPAFPGPEDRGYFELCAHFTLPDTRYRSPATATELPPPDGIERIARPGDVYQLCYRELRWPLTDWHCTTYVGRTLRQASGTIRFPGPPLWPLWVFFGLFSAAPLLASAAAVLLVRLCSKG